MEAALLQWYAREARDLPWRRTRDPYAILVSEVMLQQTQVARVVPRYLKWLERWPTVSALAAAPLPDVVRAWQGLGRYTADAVARFAFERPVLPVDTNARRVLDRTGAGFSPRAAQALMDLGAT